MAGEQRRSKYSTGLKQMFLHMDTVLVPTSWAPHFKANKMVFLRGGGKKKARNRENFQAPATKKKLCGCKITSWKIWGRSWNVLTGFLVHRHVLCGRWICWNVGTRCDQAFWGLAKSFKNSITYLGLMTLSRWISTSHQHPEVSSLSWIWSRFVSCWCWSAIWSPCCDVWFLCNWSTLSECIEKAERREKGENFWWRIGEYY